jgi:3-oxoacyl-[acyl-carrier-protein] synthase-1
MMPRLLAGDRGGLTRRSDLVAGREMVVAEVLCPLPPIPGHLAHHNTRNNALLLAALEPLRAQVEQVVERFGAHRVGIVIGTSTSGTAEGEDAIFRCYDSGALPESFNYGMLEFGGPAAFLRELLETAGPAYVISTACSSGARALASGRSLLNLGVCDAVIAGGADSLCRLTTNGFSALQAVSPEASNPFSRNRRGLTLGEGAALILMTREETGVQLLGVGESSEAHHMSAPDPEGRGAEASMRGALEDANRAPEQIAYLNLHGTGTRLNDAMEAKAAMRTLGAAVPCSSTKPLTGHTLGAAGALEAVICWALLRDEGATVPPPPHTFDGEIDPELEPIQLAEASTRISLDREAAVMSNSFGFGGNNCTLVLGR